MCWQNPECDMLKAREASDHTWLTLLAVTECAVLQFTNKKSAAECQIGDQLVLCIGVCERLLRSMKERRK